MSETLEDTKARLERKKIKEDFEQIANFGWEKKGGVIKKYIALMEAQGRSAMRGKAKLREVDAYFDRNPHRKRDD